MFNATLHRRIKLIALNGPRTPDAVAQKRFDHAQEGMQHRVPPASDLVSSAGARTNLGRRNTKWPKKGNPA